MKKISKPSGTNSEALVRSRAVTDWMSGASRVESSLYKADSRRRNLTTPPFHTTSPNSLSMKRKNNAAKMNNDDLILMVLGLTILAIWVVCVTGTTLMSIARSMDAERNGIPMTGLRAV